VTPRAEELLNAILNAMRRRDMQAVSGLLRLLAVEDPDAAQRIVDMLDIARAARRP
jgi:hypothetical protein